MQIFRVSKATNEIKYIITFFQKFFFDFFWALFLWIGGTFLVQNIYESYSF